MSSLANLIRWEWFKLRRRRMLWFLLVVAILFSQLSVWGSFFAYRNINDSIGPAMQFGAGAGRAPRTFSCNDLLSDDPSRRPADLDPQVIERVRAQCLQQAAQQPALLRQAYDNFALPGSIPRALSTLQTLGLILIAVLTASAIGIDYGSGTLRSVLVQGTGRWPYLAAKLLTLAVLAGLAIVLAMIGVAAGSTIAERIVGTAPLAPSTSTWSSAGIALWKGWLVMIPYVAFTALVTVLARSSAAGMAIGLGYYFGEQIVVALVSGVFTWGKDAADFLLVHSISVWTGTAFFGAPGSATGDAARAGFVLLAYTLALAAIALWIFQRRDVHGSTAGG